VAGRAALTRMGQLDAAVSWSMAARLANDVAARTGTPLPAGVAPAAYLAAVLQERQARDARRAFGEGRLPGAAQPSATGAVSGPVPGAGSGRGPAPGSGGQKWRESAGEGRRESAGRLTGPPVLPAGPAVVPVRPVSGPAVTPSAQPVTGFVPPA
jgi:hypothetical protein